MLTPVAVDVSLSRRLIGIGCVGFAIRKTVKILRQNEVGDFSLSRMDENDGIGLSLLQHSADIAEGVFDAGGMEGFVVVDDVAGGTTAIEKVVGLAALGAVNPFVFFNTID